MKRLEDVTVVRFGLDQVLLVGLLLIFLLYFYSELSNHGTVVTDSDFLDTVVAVYLDR